MATYFVRSSGGNDTNAGTSFALGWATLQKGFDTAVAGDTVLICADGTHSPTATVDIDTNSGTNSIEGSGAIAFRGAASDGTDDGTVATIDGAGITSDHVFDVASNNIDNLVFKDLIIQNATSNGINGSGNAAQGWSFINIRITGSSGDGISWGGLYTSFVNCEIDNNSSEGIISSSAFNFRFSRIINCSIHDNGSHGIFTRGSSVTILNNVIYDNGGDGLSIRTYIDGHTIMNNTFWGNSGDGLGRGDDGSPVVTAYASLITNNVFSDNGAYGVSWYSNGTDDCLVDYNLFNQNTSGNRENFPTDYSASSPADGTDPGFTSETNGSEDFTPASGSALIDAGLPIKTA